MNQRPTPAEYAPPVHQYASIVPDGNILDILDAQHASMLALLQALTPDQADHRYAEGKWSVKEVVGHIMDNERVWAYRLLRIARGDAQGLVGYDENIFAANAPFASLPLADVIAEYDAVRRATLYLLRGLPEPQWSSQAEFAGHPLTVRAAAYMIAGHELHHVNVVNERYLKH